jgi:hypothetical protein
MATTSSAQELLGPGHPLVAVLDTCGATVNGIAAVAAVQLGALPLWWNDESYAVALAIGAAIVQIVLVLRWAVHNARVRELCLELVIAGRGALPLAAVSRVRRRLASPRLQRGLASTLDSFASAARDPRRHARHRVVFNRRVMAAVESQLRGIAARLRAGDADVRGVALLHRLITNGTSPLYGDKSGPLRDELARARYLLERS